MISILIKSLVRNIFRWDLVPVLSQLILDFTQADINQGKVWYSQNDSFVYADSDFVCGSLLDSFVFNVTNGLSTLADQRFYFDVIPRRIPLRLALSMFLC